MTGADRSGAGIRGQPFKTRFFFTVFFARLPIRQRKSWHTALMLAPTLPDLSQLDREALRALLLAEHQERIATHQQLLRRESEIEHLKLLLSQLRGMQFGRKSEKLERQIEQLELRLEDLQQAQAAEETPPSGERPGSEASQPTVKVKPARRPLPEHLPRQTQTHVPKASVCPDFSRQRRSVGLFQVIELSAHVWPSTDIVT